MPRLVLTRNEREQVLIGDDIVVTVIAAGRGRARLLFDAPAKVRVLRRELLDRQAPEPEPEPQPVPSGEPWGDFEDEEEEEAS